MGKERKGVNAERKRRRFGPEFKMEAVRLLELGQKPATQLALELGVARNKLYQWQEQAKARGKEAFQERLGRPVKSEQDEVALEASSEFRSSSKQRLR